jgi:DNA-binding GntR family transcriptional regulator
MSASNGTPEISKQSILNYFRMSPDAFVNTRELSNHFGVTRQTVNNYLSDLQSEGLVTSKECGSAQGWWLSDR